jgi:hypothetical protein
VKFRDVLLAICLFIVAGAYGQDVHYNYDRGTNFALYKTYQWVDLPGRVPDQLIGSDVRTGKQSSSSVSPSWITPLNEQAAQKNNQVP